VRDESKNVELSTARHTHPALPIVVDRATWRANQDALLVREEAHLREGNAIAAAHRRLPACRTPDCLGWGSARAFQC
jgi:hypothetical protein